MSEPSPLLAEARDMELATTRARVPQLRDDVSQLTKTVQQVYRKVKESGLETYNI